MGLEIAYPPSFPVSSTHNKIKTTPATALPPLAQPMHAQRGSKTHRKEITCFKALVLVWSRQHKGPGNLSQISGGSGWM